MRGRYVVRSTETIAPLLQRLQMVHEEGGTLLLDVHTNLFAVAAGDSVDVALDDTLGYACTGTVLECSPRSLLGSCGGLLVLLEGVEHTLAGGATFVLSAERVPASTLVEEAPAAKRTRARLVARVT